ncbi:MAG: helix-turn-helix transcriptional regulator [Verrucomicrobia bacterium]|nr:helix-turn-helix transcriptional regulator [Verrucomicrobiota bacterium]
MLKETGAPNRLNLNLSAATLQKVLDAQAWAESHIRETIILRDWAGSTGWNPVYFGRMFKLETAYRPMKWLEERRMGIARELLLGGDLSIARVAESVGYPDSFYFSQVFKKYFGRPPLQYRKSGLSLAGSQTDH